MIAPLLLLSASLLASAAPTAAKTGAAKTAAPRGMVAVGAATFVPGVAGGGKGGAAVDVDRFFLDVELVSRRDFAAFVADHPEWQRGQAPALFVDERYLDDWGTPASPGGDIDPRAPATSVSWFAARAYCAAQGKRLPTTHEWELAAAASSTKKDARADAAFVAVDLDWYARPAPKTLPAAGTSKKNAWGVRDLHGLVWEWVDDFGAALVSADARGNDAKDVLQFCGAAGASAVDPTDYAAFMRLAFRSSLEARFSLPLLGFRCAKDAP